MTIEPPIYRTSPTSAVVCNASKQHGSATNLLCVQKPGLIHQAEHLRLRVVLQVFVGMKQMRKETMLSVAGPLKIEHVKFAAGLEDAPRLAQRLHSLAGRKMMKHKSRENAVKRFVRIGKFIGESLIELNGYLFPSCFMFGSLERFCIGV